MVEDPDGCLSLIGFVVRQLSPAFVLIGLGALLARRKLLDAGAVNGLTLYTLWLSFPALLISRLAATEAPALQSVGFVAAYGVALALPYLLAAALASALSWPRRSTGAFILAAGTPNDAFLGAPLALAVVGPASLSRVSLLLAANWGVIFPVAVAGARFERGDGRPIRAFARGLLNPMSAGALVGVVLMVAHRTTLQPLTAVVSTLAASSSPVALVALGASVTGAATAQRAILKSQLFLVTAIRLVLAPLLTFAILSAFPCPRVVRDSATLLSACPTALGAFIQAKSFAPPASDVALIVLVTTFASGFSLAVWSLLLRSI